MSAHADAKEHMDKALEAMRREFGAVRTGKATSSLLDMVRVRAYGSMMPLNQVATVSVPESRMLVVQPWDKGLLGDIERGIRDSNLGLNPMNDGNIIRVPIPALNEERRKELAKSLHKLAEEGRVAVRHSRQEANKDVKQQQSDGKISEDDSRREQDKIQKLTDEYIAKIEQMLKTKEEEVMEV
jgi:ribosome recycling factor